MRVRVAIVTFESLATARTYKQQTGLSWPILLDTDRKLYAAYGMERGSIAEVLGLRSWWIYAKLLVRGRRLRSSAGDIYQLGGDVLIDPEGRIRLHHVGRGPADRPSIDQILQLIESL